MWKQTPSLKWEPKISIESNEEKNRRAFKNHIQKMDEIYKHNVMVNLIDRKKQQLIIGE